MSNDGTVTVPDSTNQNEGVGPTTGAQPIVVEDEDNVEEFFDALSDRENLQQRLEFAKTRKPSWISEQHPSVIDNDTRKKMREEFRRNSLLSSSDEVTKSFAEEEEEEESEDDDDVDDDDMKYGLDPGFATLDEELRVIEGMIKDHTIVEEIETSDESDSGESAPLDESIAKLTLKKKKAPGTVESTTSSPTGGEAVEKEDKSITKPQQDHHDGEKTATGHEVDVTDEQVTTVADTTASAATATTTATPPSPPHTVSSDAVAAGAPVVPTVDEKPSKVRRKVRLVELPDYLAMVARDHKRQLLEKQKRDLLLATQAANAREANKTVAPRSQNSIRRGYFDRLGIAGDSAPVSPSSVNASRRLDMGINARRAAIASARTRRRPPSMRMKLRDASQSNKGKSIFKKITSWMTTDKDEDNDSTETSGAKDDHINHYGSHGSSASSTVSSDDPKRQRVNFQDVVNVYFIPARTDYPAKIRNAIWHTRAEFVDMVMTNMDQVELEMQQEADAKRRLQDLKQNPPPSISH